MTQAGGPAAINGFLYQILQHLGWLTSATLTGKVSGQNIENACLVLEPENGGDARAEASNFYIVEQYKTRENRTWPLSALVSVLRDLRKAIPSSRLENARYRFVTDGRAGRLSTFRSFLAEVNCATGPDALDSAEKKSFRTGLTATSSEFFDHVVAETQTGASRSIADDRAAVFHLLSRFEMEFEVGGGACVASIEGMLRPFAPDLGDERKVRERLVGTLMGRLSKGETRLDTAGIDALLHGVGLSPARVRRLADLSQTAGHLTRRRFARFGYDPNRDVRDVPCWPKDRPVLVIAGESGTGKTWQLGKLLDALIGARQITTLLSVAETTENLLARASRDIWQTCLGETSDKSLVAVSNFLRELAPNASTPRLTVAIDDIQDVDLARDLVRQDWADWDMRLVLTVPLTVARSLRLSEGDTIVLHTVREFSVDELDEILKPSGQRWADLPEDMKRLLRSPILAGLFLELPYTSIQTAPRSEYEIFERLWERITARGQPGDEGVVTALASKMREGNPYPLPRPMWHEIGLINEGLRRLEAAGWLRSTENGEVALAHDRLLNWAVAKSLVWEFQSRRLDVDRLGALIAGDANEQHRAERQRLNYVPMDVFWLLAADEKNYEILTQIVIRMESSRGFGVFGDDLYIHHLATLGQRAVAILVGRLQAVKDTDSHFIVDLVGKAFASLARQENVDLDKVIDSLVDSHETGQQEVAIAALTAAPDPLRLDRLWEIHQQHLDALQDETDVSTYRRYRASFDAMSATIEKDPEWLRKRILISDAAKERVSELGFFLHSLERPIAVDIWNAVGDELMRKVPPSKPRSLLRCIARFSDCEKLDFVLGHLSHAEDMSSGAALEALAILNPSAAVDRLGEVENFERYATRNSWVPVLLHTQPKMTRRRILELAKSDPMRHRVLVDLFWERPNDLDETMFRFLLRALEDDFREHIDDPGRFFHYLSFLARIARPELLSMMQAEAGGELERLIAVIALTRLNTNSNWRDSILEDARVVLILMGGDCITNLIVRELESDNYWVRHGGLNWAFVRADDRIVEGLATIGGRPIPSDKSGRPKSDAYQEYYQAVKDLAALGADEVLVDVLWKTKISEVPVNINELRGHKGAMPNSLTDEAVNVLRSTEASNKSLLTALVIAGMSGDANLIPPVRLVLKRADPNSLVGLHACFALQELGDQSEEFARLAACVAQSETNARGGLNALVGLGDRGLSLAEQWLQNQGSAEHSRFASQVIRALYNNAPTRKAGVAAAARYLRRSQLPLDQPIDIAAEVDDPKLREQIFDKAFAARSSFPATTFMAIQGLAKFDAARAVEAIELGLQSHPKIERQLCELLVKISPEIAPSMLIDAAISFNRDSLCRSAGQALRQVDLDLVEQQLIERMSGSSSERKAAADLAAWLPSPSISKALGHLADEESVREVRLAALSALDHHREEATVRALMAQFPSGDYQRRWALLLAILEIGDPYQLSNSHDPLWLGNILVDNVPEAFAVYAESSLQQRKKKAA